MCIASMHSCLYPHVVRWLVGRLSLCQDEADCIGDDRLIRRLRGAGRIKVDDAPIAFHLRDSTTSLSRKRSRTIEKCSKTSKTSKTANSDRDVLVEVTNSVQRTISKKRLSTKLMDFRTPTVTKPSKQPRLREQTPAAISPCKEHPIDLILDEAIFSTPLQASTPEANVPLCLQIGKEIVVKDAVDSSTRHTASSMTVEPTIDNKLSSSNSNDDVCHVPRSGQKRKVEHVDMSVPVQSSPAKKIRKKLNGVLRELGPGASRFIVGAPNYVTPARLSRAVGQQTKSNRRTIKRVVPIVKISYSESPIVNRSKLRGSRLKKACQVCGSLKAWSRWHSTGFDSWKCHRCYKEDSTLTTNQAEGGPRRRDRAGITLSTEEHILLMVRHKQGCTFQSIATELKKWKTGQSVRNYFHKPTTQRVLSSLEAQISARLAMEAGKSNDSQSQHSVVPEDDLDF